MTRRDITVVKLGGSFATSHHLKSWLAAMSECAGDVVLVPGGGPFADAVRTTQAEMGFDDEAAHRMALLAMEQYGCAIIAIAAGLSARAAGLRAGAAGLIIRADLVPADSGAAIGRALADGKVPVWQPSRMVLAATDVPWSWDVTADSLAAWLAGELGAENILLVKRRRPSAAPASAQELAETGLIDPLFGAFLARSGARAAVAGPDDHAQAAAAIRGGAPCGVPIDIAPTMAVR
jgi:5-(aminomethyl)-3-furanmethanol phosphate kinase